MGGDSFISQIGVFLGTILGIILILYLAYISTKFIGKRYAVKSGGSKKIKILDSVSVGKDGSIMIVRAGEKVFLVGAASGGINLISELDNADFPDEETNAPPVTDFKSAFKSVLEKKILKKNEKENENDSSGKK